MGGGRGEPMAEGTPSGTGVLVKMDSAESRWISGGAEEVYSEREDGDSLLSEEEDAVEQRLIRTGPQVDSFDVEALDVPGALRNDYEVRDLAPAVSPELFAFLERSLFRFRALWFLVRLSSAIIFPSN